MLLICIVVGVAAFFKINRDIGKILDYSKAEKYYQKNNKLLAEEYFSKAKSWTYFDYKNKEISNRLNEMSDITKRKNEMRRLKRDIDAAHNKRDIKKLLTLYDAYKGKKNSEYAMGEDNQKLFDELQEFYNMERDISKYFAEEKQHMINKSQSNIREKDFSDESFLENILLIPKEFYADENVRKAEIEAFVWEYIEKKLMELYKQAGLPKAIDEANKAVEYCRTNGFDRNGILSLVDKITLEAIDANCDKSDYKAFTLCAKSYIDFIKPYKKTTKVSDKISEKIKSIISIADKHAKEKNYELSIETLKSLDELQSMDGKIAAVEGEWLREDPAHVFKSHVEANSLNNILVVRNHWNTGVCVIAADNDSNIYFAKQLEDFTYNIISIEAFENAAIVDVKVDESLIYENQPVIIVQGKSNVRKAKILGFTIKNDSIMGVIDIEADDYYVDKRGNLIVNNPVGPGEGNQCYYKVTNEGYDFSQVKEEYIHVALPEIDNYLNEKIQLSCEIIAVDSEGGRAVGLSHGSNVLLTGNRGFNLGKATVEGKYVGKESVKKGNNMVMLPNIIVDKIK